MKKGKPRQKGDDGMDTLTQRTTGLFGMAAPEKRADRPVHAAEQSVMQDRTGSRTVPGADREALVFLPWMQRLIHFPIFACPGDRSFTGQSS